MTTIHICEKREKILAARSHLLIEGGPGSGKTTIALLKCKKLIEDKQVGIHQKVLFLSFARATIARVEEHLKSLIPPEYKRQMLITTYHSFAWEIIQSFGYLLKAHRSFKIITPPNLSAEIAGLLDEEKRAHKLTLLNEHGIVCFDLFAELTATILQQSKRINSLMADKYPYIIVDEFQDTDQFEWQIIKALGEKSHIISLADLNQRIYEFRGASIKRIPEFVAHFKPERINFGLENNRSSTSDIVKFGDDLLTGANINQLYKDVYIKRVTYHVEPKYYLKIAILNAINRLKNKTSGNAWSIAVLVKTNLETLSISSYLSAKTKYAPSFSHEVLIDQAGPSLSAIIIAKILEPCTLPESLHHDLIALIINYIRGKKEKLTKADLNISAALSSYLETGQMRGSKKQQLINEINSIISKREALILKGTPAEDWIAIRRLFEESNHEVLKSIYDSSLYIRLLNKGAQLNEKLAESWKRTQTYANAVQAVNEALTQEHFSMTSRKLTGIFVMTMHKSKGKEFDEVIIWDDQFKPIVYPNSNADRLQMARLLLRVAFTRARSKATFLTSDKSPCILM